MHVRPQILLFQDVVIDWQTLNSAMLSSGRHLLLTDTQYDFSNLASLFL